MSAPTHVAKANSNGVPLVPGSAMRASLVLLLSSALAASGAWSAERANLLIEEPFEATMVEAFRVGSDPAFDFYGPHYRVFHAKDKPYSFTISNQVARTGSRAARFEMRRVDAGVIRSDIVGTSPESDPHRWYGFSVYLPSSTWSADSQRDIIAQWTALPTQSEPGRNPPVELFVLNGRLQLSVRWASTPVSNATDGSHQRTWDLGTIETNRWLDFVVHANFSLASDGFVEVWKNGAKVADHRGATNFRVNSGLLVSETFEGTDVWKDVSQKQYTVNQPHAFQVVDNPYGTSKVGRFELRDTDATQSGGTRSEVQFKTQSGNDRWYAYKVYLPSEYWQKDNKQDIICQWHQGPTNPPLSLRVINNRMFMDIRRFAGSGNEVPVNGWNPVPTDQWLNLVYHVVFDHTDGLVDIWMNGVKVLEYRGGTCFHESTLPAGSSELIPRWKLGIYKSPWNGDVTTLVNKRVMYVDDVYLWNENQTVTPSFALGLAKRQWNVADRVLYADDVRVGNGSARYSDVAPASASSTGPTVATAAKAAQHPVTGTTVALSVLGADDGGETALTYTWSATGPKAVAFSANGTNAAKATTATFTAAGSYTLTATITDAGGLKATSAVAVTVQTTLTAMTLNPASALVMAGSTTSFAARGTDQFGDAMTSLPSISWSVSGGGSISGGTFTANSPTGSHTVTASAGGRTASASAIVAQSTVARVNMQPAAAPAVTGWFIDGGATYGARGNGLTYGWSADVSAAMRDRDLSNSPDQIHDTLVHLQMEPVLDAVWEIAVPNGTYGVQVISGDPRYFDSINRIAVEGVLALNANPDSDERWQSGAVVAQVTDGKLTVRSATGAANAKLNAVIIGAMSSPPTVATAAKAAQSLVPGKSVALSVLGADDGGEAALTYTWSATGPKAVAFSANGTNAAKATTATFSAAGSYMLKATIRDAGGLTVTSQASITVQATLTTLSLSPGSTSVSTGSSVTFAVSGSDQFGSAMTSLPAITWSVSGGGTISGGVYTAGSSAGTSTITATASGKSATATVTVTVPFNAAISFQPASAPLASGWRVDGGAVYGSRGNGLTYGWNQDISGTARDRNHSASADQMHDTMVHLQLGTTAARWDIAVPNGTYSVAVVAGDPRYFDSIHRIAVEGVTAIDGIPSSSNRWLTGTVEVQVTDGKLTVTTAAGADNAKLNGIVINAVPSGNG